MNIRGLGSIGAVHQGELSRLQPAQRRILAILIAAGPEGLSADRFAEELWPDDLPGNWEGAVRQSISRMRRAIGLTTIVNTTLHYSLEPGTNVDVWQLLHAAESADPLPAQTQVADWIDGEPYAGTGDSLLLRRSTDRIVAAKVTLINRLAQTATPGERLLESSRTLLAQEPWSEAVLEATVRLHLAANQSAEAFSLLDAGIRRLESELKAPVEPALRRLLDDGAFIDPAAPLAGGAVSGRSAPRLIGLSDLLPSALQVHRTAMFSRATDVLRPDGVIITGESGSGKTVLARHVAQTALSAGEHVLWLTAQRDLNAAYAPFLSALPWIQRHLEPLLNGGGDSFQRTACWSASLDALGQSFGGEPVVVVVDDAHWLDSQSQLLVEFLAASRVARNLRLMVVGRPAVGDAWSGLTSTLERSGLHTITVADFDEQELTELVGHIHPRTTSKQRADLAGALINARAAVPAVAAEILRSTPETTLIAPGVMIAPRESVWSPHVSQSTRAVGAVASVVGLTFRLEDVVALGGTSADQTLEAIDELLDADMVVSEQRPDEFSFRHILIHRDFEATLDRSERRRLHLAAATDTTRDAHQRARHFAAAGPVADPHDLVDALCTSAALHHADGSFREAALALETADRLNPSAADAETLLIYAISLDGSGADGWNVRRRAFDLALADGNHDLTVRIAAARAHESDDVDGNERRIELLDRVMLEAVSDAALRTHQVVLARELSLCGHHERSRACSARVLEVADDADGRSAGWVASWPTYLTTPATEWPPLPDDRDEIRDPNLRAQMLQVECVQALMLGRDTTARAVLAECMKPEMTTQPLRAWLTSLLQSLIAFTDGDWQRSNALADTATATAQQAGIASAFSARTARAFGHAWICGTHGDLLPFLEMAAPDIQESMLAEAALALALAEHPDRRGDAADRITAMASRITGATSPHTSSLAALLASAPEAARTPEATELLRQTLLPFRGTALMVGTGVMTLGPASRSLAMLAPADERAALLTEAIEQADRWNLPVWSVRCRLDLHGLTGDRSLYEKARITAAGSDMAAELFVGEQPLESRSPASQ